MNSLLKAAILLALTLLGMCVGFWLGFVVFLNLPDSTPQLPDWVWIIPYALSIASGIIGLLSALKLTRRSFKTV